MGLLINKYTLTLAWLISPVMMIYEAGWGQMEDAAIWAFIFMIGLGYMTAAHFLRWWPFKKEGGPDYVVAREVNPALYGQQAYPQEAYPMEGYQRGYDQGYQQGNQQGYQQDPYAQQHGQSADAYGQQDSQAPTYSQTEYPEP
jgi:hypothetical protein